MLDFSIFSLVGYSIIAISAMMIVGSLVAIAVLARR